MPIAVSKISALMREGASPDEIAQSLGLSCSSTVQHLAVTDASNQGGGGKTRKQLGVPRGPTAKAAKVAAKAAAHQVLTGTVPMN